jgi:hypothetical protein
MTALWRSGGVAREIALEAFAYERVPEVPERMGTRFCLAYTLLHFFDVLWLRRTSLYFMKGTMAQSIPKGIALALDANERDA